MPTFPELFRRWAVVEFAFRAELNVDLEAVRKIRSWRWFRVMVSGLLAGENLLARQFRPQSEG